MSGYDKDPGPDGLPPSWREVVVAVIAIAAVAVMGWGASQLLILFGLAWW